MMNYCYLCRKIRAMNKRIASIRNLIFLAVLPALTIDLTKAQWTVATPVMSTDIVQ